MVSAIRITKIKSFIHSFDYKYKLYYNYFSWEMDLILKSLMNKIEIGFSKENQY